MKIEETNMLLEESERLKSELDRANAACAEMREALLNAAEKCGFCNGTGQAHDGEGWINEACPDCLPQRKALSSDCGKALLEERDALRKALIECERQNVELKLIHAVGKSWGLL